jgi:pilus assembly protein TadC
MEIMIFSILIGLAVCFAQVAKSKRIQRKSSHCRKLIGRLLVQGLPKSYQLKVTKCLQECADSMALKLLSIDDLPSVVAWQVGLAVIAIVFVLKSGLFGSERIAICVVAAVGSLSAPYVLLTRMCVRKKENILNELPGVLEVVGFVMEAGLGFDDAVRYLTNHKLGHIPDAFCHAKNAIEAGMSRDKAYIEIAGAGSVEVRATIRSILLAEKQGRPIKKSIMKMAAAYRKSQENELEKAANKLPATMLIPIFLFIVPPILLIYIMPALVGFSSIY